MKMDALQATWFDLVAVAMLILGILRGRTRGMSEEILDVFQWLTMVAVGGMLYEPLGQFVADFTHMGLLYGDVTAYIFTVVMVKLLFTAIKRLVGEKLVQSDAFGKLEYFLGMLGGAFRYFCILVVALALLNAPHYTTAELAAEARKQKESFGNLSLWTVGSVQQTVFHDSIVGRWIKKHLNDQLINLVTPSGGPTSHPVPRHHKRILDEVLGGNSSK